MGWVFSTLYWYFILLSIGIIFTPLTRRFFSQFADQGYPFAKTIGILLMSYVLYLLGTLHILPFTQGALILIAVVFLTINIFSFIHSPPPREKRFSFMIIFEELLFLAALFFLVVVRGQEPSIHGLEKFMDFGFMNSILRSTYLPALDMWYAADPTHPHGYPINYYYFGHLTSAVLIKLSGIKPAIGYNLILATIFAQGITLAFSLGTNLVYLFQKYSVRKKVKTVAIVFFGLLTSFVVNLGGNLHPIYLFTKGYPNETPIPFWEIFSTYNPTKYWYPNATRFIPFTIHEFPSYSYVVADLHGHVFDIPFVLLTLAILLTLFIRKLPLNTAYLIFSTILLGFMSAVHYMTNAFDGPIYLLLSALLFLLLFGLRKQFFISIVVLGVSFVVFSLPFTAHFHSFVSGVGVNCSSGFLTQLQKFGPFLFEKEKCQISPFWMLFVLWGFFWISFLIFFLIKKLEKKHSLAPEQGRIDLFIVLLFLMGIILTTIPEFFYAKDIYPAHFRANTMFKLGYQAFMMMGVASAFAFFRITFLKNKLGIVLKALFLLFFFFIFLYPFYSFPSYYGQLNKKPQLDGSVWLSNDHPADKEIVDYLNLHAQGQPVILEAQGDSYTDYERISANTGLPTIAGWWVHEWLWRGSADVVGSRIPDISDIYESEDLERVRQLLHKYQVKYVIVSKMEKEKYQRLNESRFELIGRKILETSNGDGAIYQVN